MRVKVTDDGRFIQLVEYTQIEHDQIQHSFKKRIGAWRFHPLVKRRVWDGYISFVDKFNRMPLGLWNKLNKVCQQYNFELEFEGVDKVKNQEFNEDHFREWLWDFFKDTHYGKDKSREIRDYQIQACADTILYYKSRSELATSAGKTIIMFIVFAYLKHMGWAKRHLIIVPNTSLVIQTQEGFEEYAEGTELEGEFKIQMMGGGRSKAKTDVDVVIGTYQTLTNLEPEFYKDIDCVCVDEAHHTNAKSIKDIIVKSYDSKYRYGLSGTMADNDTAEAFTLDAYLGPVVNKVSAKFLIHNSYATPIYVKTIVLDYMEEEVKQKLYELRQRKGVEIDGAKLLDLERKLAIENKARFKYIADLICKTSKNTLVLFLDVKNEYGKNIYHYIREATNDKVVYYVDGGTASDLREEYKAGMEKGNNKVLVASFGTFSTGISINNIHHVFFVEAYKSDRIVRQSIGRGMRLLEGKDKVYIWDFVDDFSYGSDNRYRKNYLLKHGEERTKIYQRQGFPNKRYRVKL
jgi:superfamily II DNA or RNA helicase